MDRLPAEIADLLCEEILHDGKAGLLAFRLCSRKLREAATPALFRIICVRIPKSRYRYLHYTKCVPIVDVLSSAPDAARIAFNRSPFAGLVKLARHPDLARHVKKLVVLAGYSHTDETGDFGAGVMLDRYDSLSDRASGALQKLDDHYATVAKSLLIPALEALFNLEEVVLHENESAGSYAWLQLMLILQLLQEHFASDRKRGSLKRWAHATSNTESLRRYTWTMDSPFTATCGLQLSFAKPDRVRLFASRALGCEVAAIVQQAAALSRLEFVLDENCNFPCLHPLMLALNSTPVHHISLQGFALRCTHFSDDTDGPAKACEAAGLQTLCLTTAKVSSEWLLYILQQNAKTLQKICLRHVQLCTGTWGIVFDFMNCELPRLMELELYTRHFKSQTLPELNAPAGQSSPTLHTPFVTARSENLFDYECLEALRAKVAVKIEYVAS